jgi:hypothetical protein
MTHNNICNMIGGYTSTQMRPDTKRLFPSDNNFVNMMMATSVKTYSVIRCDETFRKFYKRRVAHRMVEPVTFTNRWYATGHYTTMTLNRSPHKITNIMQFVTGMAALFQDALLKLLSCDTGKCSLSVSCSILYSYNSLFTSRRSYRRKNHHRRRSSPEYLNDIIKTSCKTTALSVHNIVYNQEHIHMIE